MVQLACASAGVSKLARGWPQAGEPPFVAFAREALVRVLPQRAHDFRFEPTAFEDGNDQYEISASGGKVTIHGSSAVALLRGAYTYLRETGQAMVCWSGRHERLKSPLADYVPKRVVCPNRFVQYFNPCTFGYSTSFWDWERWEREIDWMALHGINMPLALEGQEAIWQKVWASFGVTSEEWNRFTTGPAHLPWHRMGNINRFDGPLPQTWIDGKRGLQKKILRRMLDLGMTPIVPAFAGHVPEALLRLYPEAPIFTLIWGSDASAGLPRDSRSFVLNPTSAELFQDIGKRFIKEYKKEFQAGEYYLADSFNELRIPEGSGTRPEILRSFARNIYAGIQAGDPNGKWVMQGWVFANDPKSWDAAATQAFLSVVPDDRVVILDYSADMDAMHEFDYHDEPDSWKRLDGFYGKRWICGMAQTFGGNNNVKGDLKLIASKPFEVRRNPHKGRLSGWGLDMEGIESNEVAYELLTDVGWSAEPVDLTSWIAGYCSARYGGYPPEMEEAWALLLQSAYKSNVWKTRHAFQSRPSLNPKAQFVESGPLFQKAVKRFAECLGPLGSSELYRNDLVELAAQAAGGAVDKRLEVACRSHRENQSEKRDAFSQDAFEMLLRIDALLNLRADRRLETWVGRARAWGVEPQESASYDCSSRLLITFWGWRELEDYASRMYSGLIRDYYTARWRVFFAGLKSGHPASLDEWELGWLSRPYSPSKARRVNDLATEVSEMLAVSGRWLSDEA
jgi:alpha-N-acetylglucosaminidase